MKLSSQKVIYFFCWVGVFLFCLVPLLTIALKIRPDSDFFDLLLSSSVLGSLKLSLLLSFSSLLLALFLGIPTSYLLARTDVYAARFFNTWLLFPFFVPSYLFAIAWVVLALPQVGLLNQWFGANLLNVYSFFGLVWVTCNAFLPMIITPLTQSFKKMDPSLEEAARICGASPLKTFLRISLPCQWSSVLGAALVFVFITLSSFGIPAIIGNPAKLFVLTTQIYTFSKMGGIKGVEQGFTVSLWLILFAWILASLGRKLKQHHSVALTTGKFSRQSLMALGKWKLPAFVFLSSLFSVFVILPLGALVISSFFKVAGQISWSNISLFNYDYVFKLQEFRAALMNSLSLALLGALTCCGLGLLISYSSSQLKSSGAGRLEKLACLPFSIPGTILALACIVSFGSGWGNPSLSLFGTPFLLWIAYVGKDLAIAVQNIGPAFQQVDKSLEEAGRVFGLGPLGVFDRILFPLIFPAVKSAFLLCALPMLSELTMSVLLFGPGTETLGTLIFQLQDYSNPLAACALATLLILFLGLGTFLLKGFSKESHL